MTDTIIGIIVLLILSLVLVDIYCCMAINNKK